MSDAAQPPTPGRPDLPGKPPNEQAAKIVRLPDALQDVARARRLEGEVIQQNKDGSVRVRTAEGDIDIAVRGRQPQPGQRVEVAIPPGHPPRQASVRPAPPQAQPPAPPPTAPVPIETPRPQVPPVPIQTRPPAQTPQPVPAQPAPPQGVTPPSQPPPAQPGRAPSIPVQMPLPPTAGPVTPAAPLPQAPLLEGQIVRLLPVSPAQANTLAQTPVAAPAAQPAQVVRAAFTANLIVQAAVDGLKQAAIQILPKSLSAPPPAQTPVAASPVAAPVFPSLPQPIAQILSFFRPQPAGTTPAPVGTIPAPMPGSIVTTPGAITTLGEAPATPAAVRPGPLDAQVLRIIPPATGLSDPAQGMTIKAGLPPLPSTAPQILTQAVPGTIQAQVTATTPQNLPLISLQWPGAALPQNYILQFAASNLPAGSQLQILPQPAAPGMVLPGFTPTPVQGLGQLMQPSAGWPVMDSIYQTLLSSSPQAAQALARVLPNPAGAAQFGAAALLFIAAVRTGDMSAWLGDKKIELLQRAGRGNLSAALTQESAALNRAEPVASGEWRSTVLPLFWEGEVHKVLLHVRKDPGEKDESDQGNKQTRFIFDLSLNRMGEVQLDGLLRGQRLDLVVRTATPFSAAMQQDMRRAYAHALEHTQLQGELNFQGDIKNWVQVLRRAESLGVSA